MARFSARTMHTIAEELSCDPELVAAQAATHKPRSTADLKALVEAYLANEASKDAPVEDEAPKTTTRKAPLTLSQRRALVRLQASPQNPTSAFRALPFDYLTEVGLAKRLADGTFVLTHAGTQRASEINPLYVRWSAGETVAGDPTRPAAGTHRAAATTLL
jgi:hypothetical protein